MINKLKIWQKLVLVVVLMTIPIGTFLLLFVGAKSGQINSSHDETKGLDYLAAIRPLFAHVPQHRAAALAVVSGDANWKAQLEQAGKAIDADLAAVEAVDQQLNAKNTSDSLKELRRSWQDLRGRILTLGPHEAFDLHGKFSEDLLQHMKLVGDKFGLTTDPDLDTYYMANTLLVQSSQTLDILSQLRSLGISAAARGKISAEEQAQLQLLTRLVRASALSVRRNLTASFDYNNTLEAKLGPAVGTAVAATEQLIQFTNDRLLRGNATPAQFNEAANSANEPFLKLYDLTASEARALLTVRIARLQQDQIKQLTLAVGVVLLSLIMVVIINRGIGRQVSSIRAMFTEVNSGNYRARVDVLSEDELGSTAKLLNHMLDNTLSLIQSREERDHIQADIQKLLDEISGVAEGDLTAEAEVTANLTGAIADSFNMMIAELRGIISNVQETTLQVTTSAYEVRLTAEQLAQGSESQSSQIMKAYSSINEMAAQIQRVSASASKAAETAEKALENAMHGAESVQKTISGMNSIRQHVQQTAKRMKRLGESSQEINEILQLIGDITDRTAILALNASIKAANAGEAGKGFATVAAEVEQLAERSQQATKRVSALIKSIQSDTNEAISAMEETTKEVVAGSNLANVAGQKLEQIEDVSSQLAELIQSISKSAQEQSSSSTAVTTSMGDISQVTQQSAVGAQQAARSIRELAEKANELRQSLRRFRLPAEEREAAAV